MRKDEIVKEDPDAFPSVDRNQKRHRSLNFQMILAYMMLACISRYVFIPMAWLARELFVRKIIVKKQKQNKLNR